MNAPGLPFPKLKQKRCKYRVCREVFTPKNPLQPYCCPMCERLAVAERKLKDTKAYEAQLRKETRSKLEALKTLSALAKEAEHYVNRYVRLRDRDKPCVSCDRPANWQGQWHASHLKSVGANSALRFNLWNIHKACSICNRRLAGNIGEYKLRLPSRIGQEKFDFLESHTRNRSYTREYLVRLKSIFMKRCRILEKRIGHAVQD